MADDTYMLDAPNARQSQRSRRHSRVDRDAIRLACDLCRRRKLKCSRQLPSCDSCMRLGFECNYGPLKARKPAAPRSYRQSIEQRLSQVEEQLQAQEELKCPKEDDLTVSAEDAVVLDQLYFDKVHLWVPIIHRKRYQERLSKAPTNGGEDPPIFLRHAMWAIATLVTGVFADLQSKLYHSARRKLEKLEVSDNAIHGLSFAQTQSWLLVAIYEYVRLFLHRAWMSTGRAVRSMQMLRMHCLDRPERYSMLTTVTKPSSEIEKEEWRRTFWMAFCLDRFAGVAMGWPQIIDEMDIQTLLPSPEGDFQAGRPVPEGTYRRGLSSTNLSGTACPTMPPFRSSFSALIVTAGVCGQRLTSLRRLDSNGDGSGVYGDQGISLDEMMTEPYVVPPNMALSADTYDANLCYVNLVINASNICCKSMALDQAHDSGASPESFARCESMQIEAAENMVRIIMFSLDADPEKMHPLGIYSLFVSATVFARALSQGSNPSYESSLTCLLRTINDLQKRHRLGRGFLSEFRDLFPEMHASFKDLEPDSGRDDRAEGSDDAESDAEDESPQSIADTGSSPAQSASSHHMSGLMIWGQREHSRKFRWANRSRPSLSGNSSGRQHSPEDANNMGLTDATSITSSVTTSPQSAHMHPLIPLQSVSGLQNLGASISSMEPISNVNFFPFWPGASNQYTIPSLEPVGVETPMADPGMFQLGAQPVVPSSRQGSEERNRQARGQGAARGDKGGMSRLQIPPR